MHPRHAPLVALLLTALFAMACAEPTRQSSPPPPGEPHLTVMTYNVNFGLEGDPIGLGVGLAAIRDADADIVLLQETTPAWETALRTLKSTWPHMKFHHCCGAGGLAVLSRHPITDHDVIDALPESWFPAMRTTLDTPLGVVQTLNVHLRPPFSDSGSLVSGYFSTPAVREAEIEAFHGALDPALPTIVAGDFNEDEDGGAVAFLEAEGLTSALPEFRPDDDTWRWTTSVGTVTSRLDHVAYDAALEPLDARVERVGRSDHLPVVVTFVRRTP